MSGNGSGAGLRIERRFTVEGQDPFATIEWARRDSRITNPDGSVVFEMTGAEIPAVWSQVATDIMVSKYFRKAGVPQVDEAGEPILDDDGNPVLGPERSARQVISRLAGTWRWWGEQHGYFATAADAQAFEDELEYMLVHQMAAPNSPQWFNTGLHHAYGITGTPEGFWYVDPDSEEAVPSPDTYSRPAPHACFIQAVDDDLVNPGGIMDLWVREARLFKVGSGTGSNFSHIRAEGEPLSGGGRSSGLMSFLRVGDRAAGAIKSGGTTRRAAKMVILDLDHPDIEEFIEWKAKEEDKVRALIAAGYPSDFNGEAYQTVSGQNSNNSVRVPNDFLKALENDGVWELTRRTDGEVVKMVRARELWRQIADAAWRCADPGVQFDTTINQWHTSPAGGRIRASNPCFTGDTRIATDKGLIQFKDLVTRVAAGESFDVYTHDATNGESPKETVSLTTPTQVMVTGTNEVLRLEFSDGRVISATPNHRFFTYNRGYVRADELTEDDRVRLLDRPIDFGMASWAMPVATDVAAYQKRSSRQYEVNLPEKWTEDFAHYLGWLVGDGCVTDKAVVTVYGSEEEQQTTMLMHRELLAGINGGRAPKPVEMANGTYQLRVTRNAFRRFVQGLGVSEKRAHDKRIPWSIFEAPKPIVAAFLRGLYDADGCVTWSGDKSWHVGLGSASVGLLRDLQLLLDTFGVNATIYSSGSAGRGSSYTTVDGESRYYESRSLHDLRVTADSLDRFAADIGFELASKGDVLTQLVAEDSRYSTKYWATLRSRASAGWETTYNLTEPKNHSYLAHGALVSNCSEYLFLDNTACNLASLNLVAFADGAEFDIDAYRHAIRIWTIVLEISVTMAHFPSQEIAQGSYDYRTLGLGYANLGSLLMRWGIPYDSDEGRAIAGALTAVLTGDSYATSAEMAEALGPFPKFEENRDHMLRVMRNHRHAAYNAPDSAYEDVDHHVMGVDPSLCPEELIAAARHSWDRALSLGELHGYRNAQASVLAPTGCLVGGSLIPTERGLVRLRSLGNPEGDQWQQLGIAVATDEGTRQATQFYVNGVEPVVTVTTARGHRIQGTPTHRIKIIDDSGEWVWRRFGDVAPGDIVPLSMHQLIGQPHPVPLPPLPEAYWTSDHTTFAPRRMSEDLAELVGYFMGDGSLHAGGLRFAAAREDFDVVERLGQLGKQLFGLEAQVTPQGGYVEVALNSVRLALWWEACGFAKHSPTEGHSGKGYLPHLPDAVLHSNDPEIYCAFLRGLFEADGTVGEAGYPSWSTTSIDFSHDVQALLLALGYPTTRKLDVTGWGESPLAVLRILNLSYNERFISEIGFMGDRKQARIKLASTGQASRKDRIPVNRELVDRLVPGNGALRRNALMSLNRHGAVSRRLAEQMYDATGDAELGKLLAYTYDTVKVAGLGEEQYTFDLSVPDNVTYLANGFVSHNTIGLLMDCDTTGVEPDFALVKFKKLAGGGYFKIANQSIEPALENLGYDEQQRRDIVDYVVGTMTLAGAPHVNKESLAAKGLHADEIAMIEASLPGVFDLRHAFNVFVVGDDAMERLGFTEEQYSAIDFDMLTAMDFDPEQIDAANRVICGMQTIEGAPHIREEDLPVFDTANRNGRHGRRFIHHTGHIKMMAAAQPFISGAISKTINMPNEVAVEDVEHAYEMSWELGLKAVALYRDGSKASQPLSASADEGNDNEDEPAELADALEAEAQAATGQMVPFVPQPGMSPAQAYEGMPRPRFLLPARRGGWTQEARIGGHKVFLRTGEYEDGTLGEVFIDLAKEGATLRGVLSCFAIAVSKGLQYGVPLDEFVDTFTFQTFEPRGMVEGHPNIKMANSIVDYVFRALGMEYLGRHDLVQVPPRERSLPEPPKGAALEVGQQQTLTESAMESDIDAQRAAADFVDGDSDGPLVRPTGKSATVNLLPRRPAEVRSGPGAAAAASVPVVADAAEAAPAAAQSPSSTATMTRALGDLMGDAPFCDTCGHITVRNGSCYRCLNCGESKGCS